MYFKVTNARENHNGFQYVDGLNVLVEKFNDDPNNLCCANGFYFTDISNIFNFLDDGIFLREIQLPTGNPDFKMIRDHNKWRANMIILGKRYDLFTVNTFEYLISCGASIHVNNYALRYSALYGHLDIVKYLIDNGANLHDENDCALRFSAEHGHLSIVKYLIENGADIHANDDYALKLSAQCGYLNVVEYLIENGANIHAGNDYPLRWSAYDGHLDVVKYLMEKGADIHAANDFALLLSASRGHLHIVKYLIENGANLHADNLLLRTTARNGHLHIVKYLIGNGADI